jgi:para-nitrobenzyl esterase
MVMPLARGLFQRAIIHSGMGFLGVSRQHAADFTEQVLTTLSLPPNDAAALLTVPFKRLLDAQAALRRDGVMPGQPAGTPVYGAGTGNLQLGPVFGGGDLPSHPFERDAPPMTDVPLIIGTTKDEMALYWGLDPRRREVPRAAHPPPSDGPARSEAMGEAEMVARARALLGDHAADLVAAYRRSQPDLPPAELLTAIMTGVTRVRSIDLAERKLASGSAPVYMYLFRWETPVLAGKLKACHALDIPFVFDNVTHIPLTGSDPRRVELATTMSSAWANFARTGWPGYDGLEWPEFSLPERPTLVFDTTPTVVSDPSRDERLAWAGVL